MCTLFNTLPIHSCGVEQVTAQARHLQCMLARQKKASCTVQLSVALARRSAAAAATAGAPEPATRVLGLTAGSSTPRPAVADSAVREPETGGARSSFTSEAAGLEDMGEAEGLLRLRTIARQNLRRHGAAKCHQIMPEQQQPRWAHCVHEAATACGWSVRDAEAKLLTCEMSLLHPSAAFLSEYLSLSACPVMRVRLVSL